MKIGIIGGGTAGLIASLILKKSCEKLNIEIIRSDKLGIIGVGEGSENTWNDFMSFVGIDPQDLIKNTDATFKFGVMFENWTKKPYFHSVDDNLLNMQNSYGYMIKNKYSFADMTVPFLWNNKVGTKSYPNQYHFNTFKLNTFLSNIAKSRGIKITNDEIKKVNTVENKIKSLVGEKKKYSFDFYIDCTGFKRLLISSLGAKWISYSKYLCMNSAIAFPTKDTDEYNPYTLARAMSAGWMWRIPTFGRWGNGYIFNDKYITETQAKKECEKYLGHSITIAKKIKFNPGRLDKSWINNCCALGLSSNFMEPMEASSIGTSIKQSFMLAEDILQYNDATINFYNKRLQIIIENIRDFIVLHYLCNKKDSVFWKDKPFKIPDTLQKYLDIWKVRMPNKNDFQENKLLFYQSNFILILHGIGLISNKQLKHLLYPSNISTDIKHLLFFYSTTPVVSHKNYLKQIKLKSI